MAPINNSTVINMAAERVESLNLDIITPPRIPPTNPAPDNANPVREKSRHNYKKSINDRITIKEEESL